MIDQLAGHVSRLETYITSSAQRGSAESKYGLMSEMGQGILGELRGLRTDAKTVIPTMMRGSGGLGRERTPIERERFGEGLAKGKAQQEKATELENKLFGLGDI